MRGWRNWQTRTFEVRVVYPWGFESPPSHQKPVHIVCWFFFLCEGGDLEQGGGAQRRKQSAQCNNDDRSLRLKQGGVVGAAF